jgi:lipopolysaccharide export system ATP-binding protein
MSISITTKDLVKRYRQRTVVNHVSIDVKQGEIVGLLGPNGAGKTTTFYQVVGLIKPDEGNVFLNDTDITKLPMYKRAKLGIGYLPQEASVFRKLTVEDNIMAVLQMTKMNKEERREKLETLIREFRLEHVRKSNGDVVSGGERRRTEIARALATDPKFILLDEPFAGIDPIAVEDIQAIVARLKYKNIGILITDHNVTETLSICDRAYLLIEGKIFKHGTAEELSADDEVKRLYLGRNFELRRKDYLHEEARASFRPVATTETNPSRLIVLTEHTIVKTKSILGLIDDLGRGNKGKLADNIKADEYMKELGELKASLIGFASNIEHEELVQKALAIPDLDFKDYEKIFSFSDHISSELDLLKNHLIEVDSILDICAIYLKAIL